MKRDPELERVALKEILTLRRDGGNREDAFATARLLFQLKQRLDEAELERRAKTQ